jgi:amino acid transporter
LFISLLLTNSCLFNFENFEIQKGKTTNFEQDFSIVEKSPAKWATAFYFGLYSYDGWSALNNIVEEIKKPKRYDLDYIL